MEKIIQFGEGGFLRGFVDWMIQICNEKTDFDGEVVVVQPIAKGMCDVLAETDCNYTHVCQGLEGVEEKWITCLSRCVKPYDDFDAYIALAENPNFRFIVSNTTEAGICFDDRDKITDRPASSFPGKLTQLLKHRFELGLPGFVFLPCELTDRNGDLLKKCVLQYADLWELGADFKNWIEAENIFCCTLVDRINTGFPGGEEKMRNTSEYFHLWVIEGDEALSEELPFHKMGLNVIWTKDLERYRTRKVRILNGAHTATVAYALLEGFDTVLSCMENEKMLAHIRQCVFEEIIPTLSLPKEELVSYANDVLQRFANPHIRHFWADISLNSVSKFKVRVLPSLLAYYEKFGKAPEGLTKAFGCLIRFYKEGTPRDDEQIIAAMRSMSVKEILANTEWWDTDCSFLYEGVNAYADPSQG